MSKIRTGALFIMATTIFIVAIFSSIYEDAPSWLVNISSIFTAFAAYFLFLKDNSIKVFILWHKFLGYFKKDTVAWSATYKFSHYEESYNFNEDVDSLIKRLKVTLGDDVKINSVDNDNENYATFTLFYKGYNRLIKIYNNQSINENIHKLSINYEVSLSFSDARNEIERYRSFLNLLNTNHKVIGKESITENSEKELYSIKMSFSENNPFYGLAIKHIDEHAKSVRFNLSFYIGNTKLTTTNKTLKAVSEDREQLINVLKDFIALSNVG